MSEVAKTADCSANGRPHAWSYQGGGSIPRGYHVVQCQLCGAFSPETWERLEAGDPVAEFVATVRAPVDRVLLAIVQWLNRQLTKRASR